VGAAVLLTGTIAVVNAAPSNANSSSETSSNTPTRESDDGSRSSDDDYGSARPYTPTQQTPTQQAPTFTPQPQTRTRGS
jgi:hypothetical protein